MNSKEKLKKIHIPGNDYPSSSPEFIPKAADTGNSYIGPVEDVFDNIPVVTNEFSKRKNFSTKEKDN